MVFSDILPQTKKLHYIVKLAAALPKLVREVPLLRSGTDAAVVLSQLQIASLLCNAFLCTFPPPARACGAMNMERIFEASNHQKLKCILHYLTRVVENNYTAHGLVRFHRRCLRALPQWDQCGERLSSEGVAVSAKGKIEDTPTDRNLHSDFANKILGGGVLTHGLVQEEIRFLLCPELIVGRLFCEELADNEVVMIQGAERFSNYVGYGYQGFEWRGDHNDVSQFEGSFRVTTVVAFDAQNYKKANVNLQYLPAAFTRELNKAYCAFFREQIEDEKTLATGNWGAGVFLGNPHLKYLIQIMAAAVAGRRLLYLTWEDEVLAAELTRLSAGMEALGMTVAELYASLSSFDPDGDVSLFEHVMARATETQ